MNWTFVSKNDHVGAAAGLIGLLLALSTPFEAVAQHAHYKLIDVGTLGGPNSGVGFEGFPLNALSSQGVIAACSDTSIADPNYPNFNPSMPQSAFELPQPNPMIFHAFEWKDGKLTDLGALPGVNSSCPNHISGDSLIAGASQNGVIDPNTGWPEIQAVLWRHGEPINLGTLGGSESYANSVNNRGQVVGLATNATPDPFGIGFGQQARAFLWENGHMHDLGTLGGPDAFAIDINDRGQVLGYSFINSIADAATGIPTGDGFLWENGKMIGIPDALGGTQVSPFFLSNKGEVLGAADLPGDLPGQEHPFLWKNGAFTDLGTLGGTQGRAQKINAAGQIIGDATFAGDVILPNGLVTLDHAVMWRNGEKLDLGTVENDACSQGFDINSHGQAVGWSGACDQSVLRAALWENGRPAVDLNTLTSSDTGIYVYFAVNINDRGEIAAAGTLPTGENRAVLLIPCDEEHPGVEGCDYSPMELSTVAASHTTPQRQMTPEEIGRIHTLLMKQHHGFMPRKIQ
jgi:probable HAF family extracellular repeat protein